MSELPLDYRAQLDLRAEIARIDRDRAEAEKFAAEQRKLISESRKMDRDRWLAPLFLAASLLGGVIVAILSHVWR
jgi:hypothetical protein